MAYIYRTRIEEGPKWKGLPGFAFSSAATLGAVLGGVFTTKSIGDSVSGSICLLSLSLSQLCFWTGLYGIRLYWETRQSSLVSNFSRFCARESAMVCAYRFTIKLAARLSFGSLRTMLTAGSPLLSTGTILVGCGLTLQTSFMLAQIVVDKEDLAQSVPFYPLSTTMNICATCTDPRVVIATWSWDAGTK
ncbi:hypothetical protein C8J56DRAFT_1054551 [Mycena floridula]|nr:hypothetical protein C8J56DRAFT_1054551 [Mycena floridula]